MLNPSDQFVVVSESGGAPEIHAVTGTYAEGQQLVISGIFSEEGPLVLGADNFHGKVDGQLLDIDDAQIGQYYETPNLGEYVAGRGLAGNTGLLYQDSVAGWNSGYAPVLAKVADDAVREAAGIPEDVWNGKLPFRNYKLFVAYKGEGGRYNSKDAWLGLGNLLNTSGNPNAGNDIVLLNDDGLKVDMFSNNAHIVGGTVYPASGTYQDDSWTFNTITSDMVNGPDGLINLTYSGRVNGEINDTVYQRYLDWSTKPKWYDRIKMGAYAQSYNGTSAAKRWLGAFYFAVSDEVSGDDSYANCCVEIFNAATPETSSIRGILPSASWTSSSITVNCWTLGIAEIDAYIRVTNKDNTTSAMVKLSEALQ